MRLRTSAAIVLGAMLAVPSAVVAQFHFDHAAAWGVGYPDIQLPSSTGTIPLSISVSPNGGGLALQLSWSSGRPTRSLPEPIADASKISVRLHVGGGTVITPADPLAWIGGFRDVSVIIVVFPWQRNAMDEAWFEVTAAGVTHWIELPYGLARDPHLPEADGPLRGYPRFPKAMANLGDRDTLVPWLRVGYDVGDIHDRLRLSFQIVNGSMPRIETTIHHAEDPRSLLGSPGWTLERPVVSADVHLPRGRTLAGVPRARRLEDDGVRSDEFRFAIETSPEREWATVVVHVDGRSYHRRVPSSLFKRFHGVTDPGNPRRMVVPWR